MLPAVLLAATIGLQPAATIEHLDGVALAGRGELVVSLASGELVRRDLAGQERWRVTLPRRAHAYVLALSPDGVRLAVPGIGLYDARTGRRLAPLPAPPSDGEDPWIPQAAVFAGPDVVALAQPPRYDSNPPATLVRWSPPRWRPAVLEANPFGSASALAASPSGELLAGEDVRLFGARRRTLAKKVDAVAAAANSAVLCAALTISGTVLRWPSPAATPSRVELRATGRSAHRLAPASPQDRSRRAGDVKSDRRGEIWTEALSPDCALLAVSPHGEARVQLFDATTGTLVAEARLPEDPYRLAFAPDESALVADFGTTRRAAVLSIVRGP